MSITSIPKGPLGRNGPVVAREGLGLMGLSAFYGTIKDDKERLAFLDKAYELGQTFWDTADMYGDNEDLLNVWFKRNPEKRANIFLATKFANRTEGQNWSIDSSPEYAKQALEKSLQRLGLPSIDLYYCHRLDGKTPVEKTVKAMAEMKAQGKFKYLGLSEVSAASLRRAHAVHPITAVQVEYSPFALDIESPQYKLLETARELGVAIVAYSPIGRGMLSGTIKSPDDFEEGDFRRFAPRFSKENFHKNFELVEKIVQIAQAKKVTPSQLTLAWLMAQGEDIFPIPGTTRVDRLVENVEACQVKLTAEEERQIREACEAAEVHGARYPGANTELFADTPELDS